MGDVLAIAAIIAGVGIYGVRMIGHGLSARDQPRSVPTLHPSKKGKRSSAISRLRLPPP
jgi:hypothetical protein